MNFAIAYISKEKELGEIQLPRIPGKFSKNVGEWLGGELNSMTWMQLFQSVTE
jgi:hypothetical protein